MMKAKDTVMNEQGILEACVGASIPPSLDYETELLVAQAQAEISFKAGYEKAEKEGIERLNGCKDACQLSIRDARSLGIKEVVKVINAELVDSDSRNMWYLNRRFWQAKLKEWGI